MHHPVELIEVHVATDLLAEFLEADHEVWTMGEVAAVGQGECIPIISKEVSVDDSTPLAKVFITIVWESMDKWQRMNEPTIQNKLLAAWAQRFPHPHEMIRLDQPGTTVVKRVSRFERVSPAR